MAELATEKVEQILVHVTLSVDLENWSDFCFLWKHTIADDLVGLAGVDEAYAEVPGHRLELKG